jgi:hypothetical protein
MTTRLNMAAPVPCCESEMLSVAASLTGMFSFKSPSEHSEKSSTSLAGARSLKLVKFAGACDRISTTVATGPSPGLEVTLKILFAGWACAAPKSASSASDAVDAMRQLFRICSSGMR